MRQNRWIIILVGLLLSACGGAQQAEQPTTSPTTAATSTAAATSAPTATSALASTSAPAPTATGSAEAPTAELFRAEPTAPLILQPTATPAANEQPAPTSAPAATASTQSTAQAAPAVVGKEEKGQPGEPARIVIDAVGIDQPIVSVGLDKHRVPVVPNHEVGWYNLSSQPGQGDNIVLWGHVLRFREAPKIPAPFARLKEVKPGAKVVLYDQGGKAHNYVVKQQIWVKPDQVEYILPQGKELVTLVSCIGDKVITKGEVVDESHRLITVAEPA